MSAVYIVFIGSGLAFASWASRIPQVRDRLEVTPAQLGLLLWCIAVGSVIAMPISGLVVSRFGEARTRWRPGFGVKASGRRFLRRADDSRRRTYTRGTTSIAQPAHP
jgi:hypothetical protein